MAGPLETYVNHYVDATLLRARSDDDVFLYVFSATHFSLFFNLFIELVPKRVSKWKICSRFFATHFQQIPSKWSKWAPRGAKAFKKTPIFFAHPGCDASVTVWAVRHASLIIIRARNQVSRVNSDAEAAKQPTEFKNNNQIQGAG